MTQNEVKNKKPSPEVYNKTIEKLNVPKEKCLIIEDSLIGVQAANAAHIDVSVIYDKYSDGDREQINQLSNYQFQNYEEAIELLLKEVNHIKRSKTR